MIIYKITNKINGKVYIGQTIHTLAHRKSRHIRCANKGVDRPLYRAMRKYGIDNFTFSEIAQATTIDELNYLETKFILEYDSVRCGYNMCYGGDNNVMFSPDVKAKHNDSMKSQETREKISMSLKEYRKHNPFSEDHRKRLSNSAMGNHNFGTGDTRSIGCYCITSNGDIFKFHSYRDGYRWWCTQTNPFQTNAECVYQRKIKQSIECGCYTYKRTNYEYPKWFREVGDNNEVAN